MNLKYYYWFSYPIRTRSTRLKVSQARDPGPIAVLSSYVAEKGYKHGGMIFNPPAKSQHLVDQKKDYEFLQPDDLVILTTRPPMDDDKQGLKVHINRSMTWLEERIFESMRGYFSTCSRNQISLSEEAAQWLKSDYQDRANTEFRTTNRPFYQTIWPNGGEETKEFPAKCTAAYFIYLKALWDGGPGLLASFGLSGPETYAWNALLISTYSRLFNRPVFAVAEMKNCDLTNKPGLLRYYQTWEVDLIAQHAL